MYGALFPIPFLPPKLFICGEGIEQVGTIFINLHKILNDFKMGEENSVMHLLLHALKCYL
jgi:hypothetical protein